MSRRNREKRQRNSEIQVIIDDADPAIVLKAICRRCRLSWPVSPVRKLCGQCGGPLLDRQVQMEPDPG